MPLCETIWRLPSLERTMPLMFPTPRSVASRGPERAQSPRPPLLACFAGWCGWPRRSPLVSERCARERYVRLPRQLRRRPDRALGRRPRVSGSFRGNRPLPTGRHRRLRRVWATTARPPPGGVVVWQTRVSTTDGLATPCLHPAQSGCRTRWRGALLRPARYLGYQLWNIRRATLARRWLCPVLCLAPAFGCRQSGRIAARTIVFRPL